VVRLTSPKECPVGLHGEFDAEEGTSRRAPPCRIVLFQWGKQIFGQRKWISTPIGTWTPPVLNNYTNREMREIFSILRASFSTSDRLSRTRRNTQFAI